MWFMKKEKPKFVLCISTKTDFFHLTEDENIQLNIFDINFPVPVNIELHLYQQLVLLWNQFKIQHREDVAIEALIPIITRSDGKKVSNLRTFFWLSDITNISCYE